MNIISKPLIKVKLLYINKVYSEVRNMEQTIEISEEFTPIYESAKKKEQHDDFNFIGYTAG